MILKNKIIEITYLEIRMLREINYPDKAETFFAQRVLSTNPAPSTDDNLWLYNNNFRTRCTVHGKVCNIIINGRSCENMVASVMVEKLGLKVVKVNKDALFNF